MVSTWLPVFPAPPEFLIYRKMQTEKLGEKRRVEAERLREKRRERWRNTHRKIEIERGNQ